jgi:hypothetical protein
VAISFDPSVLLNYYAAKLPLAPSQVASPLQSSSARQLPPWDLRIAKPPKESEDVTARNSDPYFNPKDLTLLAPAAGSGTTGAQSQIAALLSSTLSKTSDSAAANPTLAGDNDKLFALYTALNRLEYIAQMANREGTTNGQRPGLDKSFQDGLNQILSFVSKASFANLTVQSGQKSATEQSSVSVAYPKSSYVGGAVVGDAHVFDPVPGLSATDSFTISIIKGGVTSNVAIDLANVTGPLTLDNINIYANQQLAAAGFATRLGRVQTGGTILDGTATWGEKIDYRPGETVSLSSASAKPAIYVAGTTGNTTDAQGKLIKLANLDGTPSAAFSTNIAPDSGTSTANATAVDGNGNVYVVGNTTGSFGNEINQAAQDAYLTKYDSAGNVQWTKLLGAADSASGFGLSIDPKSGGVVVVGAVTGDLTPTAIGGGTDSFVAKYDSDGNQTWLRQVAPASGDQANTVSVDSTGNVYVGGQVNSAIASGQVNAGGADAYVTKLDDKGNVVYQRQFGTSGTDSASKTAIADDGNLIVASQQNGHAILTKYGSADGSSAAMWQVDLGDLQGGTLGGLTLANGKVYLSGSTANPSLNAGGAATTGNASSGGTEAFVFAATDNGATATSDFISYVGTSASDQGGGIAVAGGKIYLTGTTTGTFAGQTRNATSTHNLFVAQLGTDGTLNWTQQYGGRDGESRGLAIAADESGASVLDALKLQRGTIDINQPTAIESQTTARVGDYFTLQIQSSTGTRTAKITIAKGETMRSLAVKINGALLFNGKATALAVPSGGQGLKIAVNPGVQVSLIAGPKDFDALKGLGLKPQLLTNDSTTASDTSSSPAAPLVIGIGIDGGLDLLSKQTAAHADVALQGAMALIKQAYGKLNTPAQSNPIGQQAGSAPAYLQTQLAGYQTALAWLQTLNGTIG